MASAIDTAIDNIIKNEGGLVDNPADKGGRTFEGISEKSNPEAWKNGQPSDAQVRAIYLQKYVQGPGFDKIQDPQLQSQLIDYGVNSGPAIAIQKLQAIVGVTVDGVLGAETLAAVQKMHPEDINNHLVASRVKMIGSIVSKNPSQLQFLNGWLSRAVEFLS